MFPSFILGMYLRQNDWLEEVLSRYMYVPIIVFIVLLICKIYGIQTFYITNLLLGVSGALSCFVLFKKYIGPLPPSPILNTLAKLGGITLGVYVIQAILMEFLLPHHISFKGLPLSVIALLMPILSIAEFIVCWAIIELINKSDLLAFLMFGREFKKK